MVYAKTSDILLKLLPVGAALTILALGFSGYVLAHNDRKFDQQAATLQKQDIVLQRTTTQLALESAKNRIAVLVACAIRDDFKQRVRTSKNLLKKNPNIFPEVPRATIQNSLKSQQQTLDAIDPLLHLIPHTCPKRGGGEHGN